MDTNIYAERLASLIQLLRAHKQDAAAMVPGAGLRYLSGLALHSSERLTLLLMPVDGGPACMVLPALEFERVRAAAPALRLYPWADAEGPDAALQQATEQVFLTENAPAIAVEHTAMRVMELRALERVLPEMHTTDLMPLLARLRMVKDQRELAAMEEAARIVETALRNVLAHVRPGMTERRLAGIWSQEMMSAGAEGESFPCIVASGPNSANPHHANSDRAFQEGDMIILDGGAVYQGYASDITRTVALGEPGPQARQVYQLVQAANAAGRAAVRPGASGEQIDRAARQVIEDGGYGTYFVHRTGHGLGMECHEPPGIVAGSTQPLAVGTTFTVEPGIYLPGEVGVRIEDDMVVTEQGGRSLTTFERDLLVLPL
jgi:Xaa-Pro aminopeptidase